MAGTPINYLPGFHGPLPFQLETGYIGVGHSSEVQLFYYFIKSESNPEVDPLILWLVGGPGCSAVYAIANEIGPIRFDSKEYNGSLPTLSYRPYGYTKVANIIFIDSPMGTGFSYSQTKIGRQCDNHLAAEHAYEFLRMGYFLGNPVTFDEEKYKIPFRHGMAFISDELYESLERYCRSQDYQNIDPQNTLCLQHYHTFTEPVCDSITTKVNQFSSQRRSLDEKFDKLQTPISTLPGMKCRDHWWYLVNYWANDDAVREALHVPKGTTGTWVYCNKKLPFTKSVNNTIPYHAYLSTKNYKSLIYSGDHDLSVPFLSTQAWIKSLNYSIIDDWRPWIFQGQIAGYTRAYSNGMTYATMKGAGHTTAEWMPAETLAMLTRWLSNNPL